MEIEYGNPFFFNRFNKEIKSIILEQGPKLVKKYNITLSNLLDGEYYGYAIFNEPIKKLYDNDPILESFLIYKDNFKYFGITIKIIVGDKTNKDLLLDIILKNHNIKNIYIYVPNNDKILKYYEENNFNILDEIIDNENNIIAYLLSLKN